MSHNIEYETYPEKVNKKRVQAEWNHYVAMADRQEGCSGLCGNIRWMEKTFESENEAMRYIDDNYCGDYEQVAVKFKEYPRIEIKKTKKHLDLNERLERLRKEKYELNSAIHYKNVKSAFISCPGCQSKIARPYIKSNDCPVCRKDMRPKSTLDRISSYSSRINEVEKLIDTEVKLYNDKVKAAQKKHKPKINWLVKVEYHT